MNRDEFMELVYETFADEPDNTLANGIIEAADAYVEYEKAQLSREDATKGTTADLQPTCNQLATDCIDRQAAIDALAEQMPKLYTPDGSHPADEGILQAQEVYVDCIETLELLPSVQPDLQSTCNQLATDSISRQAAIDALWKALYEYEDRTEKQFQESDELDVEDWIQHRIFVQNMSDIDRQTIMELPPAQPEYEPVTAEDFAKTMSETSIYSYMLWYGETLTLMKRQGFVICKKTM